MYRTVQEQIEVLLVHPGGPFWAKRDDGAWSIPKGEMASGEDPLAVARREFEEELGAKPPEVAVLALGSVRQKGGKVVHAWMVGGDFDVTQLRSNTFEIEWPPRSGRRETFPEVDRAAWFDRETAGRKILPAQQPLIERLITALTNSGASEQGPALVE